MKARAVTFGALAAALLVLSGDARGQAKKYESPNAVFDAFQSSVKKKDWKTAYTCLTPDSGDRLAGQMIFVGAMIKSFAAFDKTGKLAGLVKPIDAVFDKHGLTKESLAKAKPSKDPKEQDAALLKLARLVKDRAAFLGELMPVMEKLGSKKGDELGKATLKDVKIDGDNATGTAVTEKGGVEKEEPLKFKKIGGGWRIDLPITTGKKKGAARPAVRPESVLVRPAALPER